MTTSIYAIEHITQQAKEAAQHGSHAEKACPYPFDSIAGRAFCNAFDAARKPFDDAISTAVAIEIAFRLPEVEALAA